MEAGAHLGDSFHEGDGAELLGRTYSASLGRQSSISGAPGKTLLPVARLAERAPYTILEDMPASRLYSLFAKAGVRAACVTSDTGEFLGMISRAGLISATRRIQEDPVLDEDEDVELEEEESSAEGAEAENSENRLLIA